MNDIQRNIMKVIINNSSLKKKVSFEDNRKYFSKLRSSELFNFKIKKMYVALTIAEYRTIET